MALPAEQFSTDHAKVLVVDDDPSIRLMVREVLGSAGFVIEEAEGGRQALRLFESFRPDVVLLDILMPEMDGFATLRSLRAGDAGAACPVVMITGLQDPGALEQAYQIGATDFVTKPIERASAVGNGTRTTCLNGRDPPPAIMPTTCLVAR